MRGVNHRTIGTFVAQNSRLLLLAFVGILFLAWSTDFTTFTGKSSGGSGGNNGKCPIFGKRYGIMMDAGSTGSRTHVFEFDFHPDGTIGLIREVFEQIKPGLSFFKGNPKGASNSLIPLMEVAKRDVPANIVACTPIALKATAGLRLLGKEASAEILNHVATGIRSYGFDAPADVAVVMDGKDEGPYAWITVNFLLGHLGAGRSGETAAIMDMGGASTQIVFEPMNSVRILSGAPNEFIYDATLLGSKHKMYQNSYLGLGLKEAIKTSAAAALEAGKGTSFSCLPPDFTFELGDKKITNTEGKQNFETCAAHISAALIKKTAECSFAPCGFNGIYQPKLRDVFTGPIYAFSYFYDRTELWLPVDGQITVGTYKEIGTQICNGGEEKYSSHNKGTMCADFAFLYTLLTDGYGLTDDEKLHIKKKINGIETAWALGAMIEMMK
eukprot:GILI01016134.1.p1 GENE.GILI01016134.1~~GILI01016134.1.p1  ORF type:complete len:441 (-),score=119.92 GILI01016134.1:192-1514(-)